MIIWNGNLPKFAVVKNCLSLCQVYLPIYLPAYLPTCLPVCLSASIPTCLPACLPARPARSFIYHTPHPSVHYISVLDETNEFKTLS